MEQALLQALRGVALPPERRRTVKRNAEDPKRGTSFGYAICFSNGWSVSKYTRRHPELARLLCLYAKEKLPDFRFTSIFVSEGGAALHVDKRNIGESMIVAIGDYTGGALWQYPGDVLDVHSRLQRCDGSLPHMTLPFTGERYAIIYFNKAGNYKAPAPRDEAFLADLGFATPSLAVRRKPRADLLDEAAAMLRAMGVPDDLIGDYRNVDIPRRTLMMNTKRWSRLKGKRDVLEAVVHVPQ
jgi:hypothetical protein